MLENGKVEQALNALGNDRQELVSILLTRLRQEHAEQRTRQIPKFDQQPVGDTKNQAKVNLRRRLPILRPPLATRKVFHSGRHIASRALPSPPKKPTLRRSIFYAYLIYTHTRISFKAAMDLNNLLASFANAFNQNQRFISLTLGSDATWDGVLLPQRVEGAEAVSDTYRYVVDCLSPDTTIELKKLLGLSARLTLRDQNGDAVVRSGVVSAAQATGSDGGMARYSLTIEPPFALLKLRITSRIFQDLTVPDIVKQIINEHQASNPLFAQHQTLEFHLSGSASPRSYCLQYRESDYAFIVRLLHEEGYAWRFEALTGGSDAVKLVVFDDPYSIPQSAQGRARYHRSAASESEDSLTQWQSAHQMVPGKVSLASYDYKADSLNQSEDSSATHQGPTGHGAQSTLEVYDAPGVYYAADTDTLSQYANQRQKALDAQAKQFSGSGTLRGLQAGQWFRLDDHPAHADDSAEQREFVVTQQQFSANNNLPSDLKSALASVAPSLLASGSTSSNSSSSASAPYTSSFSAQRRGIPLTPAFAQTALAKPTSQGVQSALVVGPSGEEVYTDEQGRIKIQFHWQRPQEHPTLGAGLDDHSSCWVRVAMPSAGASWGHQFIPRVGQEVLVDFIEGDIDRPVVTGVLYNGSHHPPMFSGAGSLPGNKTLSGIQSKEFNASRYNELLFDDTTGQIKTKLSSEHGKTQLNQGYLTQPRSDGKADPRGEGFELRSDKHGALRAANGLLISTEAQNGASGQQLARAGAQSQLDAALALSQNLGQVATGQLADSIETGPNQVNPDNSAAGKADSGHLQHLSAALKAWENGTNTAKDASGDQPGQQALLVMSAPAGIASLSTQSQTLAAGTNLDLVAQRDTNQTSGRRWIHNVGQHLSLFVQGVASKISLKLIAAKGNIQIQAQSGEIEVTADQAFTLTSCKEGITLAAKKQILLVSGGAYIRIADGNIEIHCPSSVDMKGAQYAKTGPASMDVPFPQFPNTVCKNCMQSAASEANPLVAGK